MLSGSMPWGPNLLPFLPHAANTREPQKKAVYAYISGLLLHSSIFGAGDTMRRTRPDSSRKFSP